MFLLTKQFSLVKQNCKMSSKKTNKQQVGRETLMPDASAVFLDKSKCVTIKILAKPGAKQNAITDITSEGVGIQINAPPIDGEANTELLKYLSKILGIRKSDLSLDKGSKSRQKIVKVEEKSLSVEEVLNRLKTEFES